ncbi:MULTISPECIES: acetyl-CoA carboxylase biotin carboxyl carrier protein [Caloramator]|uniref:Biotin carboxyl carrier protein of acetyl-CoA carboxylase n=1 Tax=Caloramator australicus RC3 TaxID=857293 RepID=I7J5B4_9CLOT|nr:MULTISPECIES: acetyl-CoA carboxylase biotin carboxyl carrier protein [Caloramator]MDO6354031.1 acetyl-CoA carboxylase biotin carboxyl carrier protein [Caloramator sp. CAR-1]CCJ33621.1 Biotin carboxyl carrier protein of acetyl-CoA carboxylase [Caloramator australicus RC3]
MDIKAIQEIIKAMDNSSLTFIEIISNDITIRMKKEGYEVKEVVKEVKKEMTPQEEKLEDKEAKVKEENLHVIKAPLVGTFYRSPGPNLKPFVEVGTKVKKGDTLCIIEAMKIMNEIQSDVDGEIVEILIENETMVEYGQELFKIRV